MLKHRVLIRVLFLLVMGSTWSCRGEPAGWTPVLEETSTAFLETETERVLEDVRSALHQIGDEPAQATSHLHQAETSLEHLAYYYLPIFRARESAYNAYRSLYLGDHQRVMRELGHIEDVLEKMVETSTGGELQEIESLAEALADARLEVEAGDRGGLLALETLARQLNQAALKGDLILER
jgi:hypothetical protein